jgi:hypothetical protein
VSVPERCCLLIFSPSPSLFSPCPSPKSNYEFAKFCWKSIVQPEMNYDADDSKKTNTRWLLDKNHATLFTSGVTDLLAEHVSRVTKESMEEKDKAPTNNCQYDLSLTTVVNSASIKFGSSHDFAKPLLETNLTNMSLNTSALLSGDGSFVETRESNDDHSESGGTNVIQFQGVMSAMYLNTKHSHMECFVEPCPCFGRATYQVLQRDPSLNPQISKGMVIASAYSFRSLPSILILVSLSLLSLSLLYNSHVK